MPIHKYHKVMLVDDDKINNFINLKLIRKIGLSEDIVVANNGKEAIDFFNEKVIEQTDLPDLILLDLNMPVMDGFEFLDEFEKSHYQNHKPLIIVLTTSNNANDLEKVQGSKLAAGYINKPLTEENLINFLNKRLRSL